MTAGESSISTSASSRLCTRSAEAWAPWILRDRVGQFLHGKLNEEDDLQKRRQRASVICP